VVVLLGGKDTSGRGLEHPSGENNKKMARKGGKERKNTSSYAAEGGDENTGWGGEIPIRIPREVGG